MKWLYQVARISYHCFSLVVAWMFGPIYTGSGASLFGEGRKLVQMPGIVSLFFFHWEQLVVIMLFVGCVWDTAPWIFGPYNHGN